MPAPWRRRTPSSLIPALNGLYFRHIDALFNSLPPDEAAAQAVGGIWGRGGAITFGALRLAGLQPEHDVLDIGCGSGRLADQLDGWLEGSYLGVDVSQRLVDYARKRFPGFRFETSDGISIPAEDDSIDVVAMFSISTHIPLSLTLRYLKSCRRIVRDGGTIVLSFLELSQPGQLALLHHDEAHVAALPHLDEWVHRDDLRTVAGEAGFSVERFLDGDDECIPIDPRSREVATDLPDGQLSPGQSVAILR